MQPAGTSAATEPTEPTEPTTATDATTTADASPDADATTDDAPAGTDTAAGTDAPSKASAPAKTTGTDATKTSPPPAVPTDADVAPEDDAPPTMTRMEAAGWWTLFGGVATSTLAGVIAGLAERQEDRALRLSVRYDLATGAQSRYADVQDEYEDTIRKGRTQAAAALALAILGVSTIIAGVTVTAVGRVRAKRAGKTPKTARHLDVRSGGLQVRF